MKNFTKNTNNNGSSGSENNNNSNNNNPNGLSARDVSVKAPKIVNMRILIIMYNNGTHGAFPRELLEIPPWLANEDQFKLYEDWMVGVVFIGGWYAKALIEQGGMNSQLLFMDRVRKLLSGLAARYQNVTNWCAPGQGIKMTK
jgi:hypothetical protein